MRREPAAFLWDIREAANLIREFVSGIGVEEFTKSALIRSAVERQFAIIGEALSQLSRIAPDVVAEIPDASRVIGFRNILIHGYATIDYPTVWRIIHENLPSLAQTVDELIRSVAVPSNRT